jgi:hypothetical protein
LQTYDIVVAFSNNTYADPTGMGDVLADYADTGGVVVGFNFNWYGPPFGLAGRWMTGGYTPYNDSAPPLFSDSTLGTFTPGHPLMQGVTSLTGFFRHQVTLASGAVQVAAWADSAPLIAYKAQAGRTGVGINVYPGENPNQWSGEFGRVVVNAGRWLMGGNPCPSPTRTITPGGPTNTPTRTSTATNTPTSTATNTAIATDTAVATDTATSTPTEEATATPTACTLEFTDVPPGHTFYADIRCLACRGIINGYNTGCETGNPCFRPGNLVTRGQLSKIVSNAAGFDDDPGPQQFEDVPAGSTFYDFIGRLANRGIISGYPCGGPGEPCVPPDNLPYFRPNANVTRGQLSKIVSEAAGFTEPVGAQQFEDVPVGSTFYDWIWRLTDRGIMNGYPCGGAGEPCIPPDDLPYFRPGANATRGQASKIVANTFFSGCVTPAR